MLASTVSVMHGIHEPYSIFTSNGNILKRFP